MTIAVALFATAGLCMLGAWLIAEDAPRPAIVLAVGAFACVVAGIAALSWALLHAPEREPALRTRADPPARHHAVVAVAVADEVEATLGAADRPEHENPERAEPRDLPAPDGAALAAARVAPDPLAVGREARADRHAAGGAGVHAAELTPEAGSGRGQGHEAEGEGNPGAHGRRYARCVLPVNGVSA
jgi:hypothetical protein